MTSFRFQLFRSPLGLILLAIMILAHAPIASAVCYQTTNGPGISDGGGTAGSGKFSRLLKEIEKNENEINRLYSTIPIGFASKQKIHREKIEALKMVNVKLRGQLDAAAMETFQANPQSSPAAVEHVFGTMVEKIDGKGVGQLFDPAGGLQIASALIEAGFNSAPVLYQAFRASYALQEFEQAVRYLESIEALTSELDPSLRNQLEDANQKWQREVQLRDEEQTADDLPRVKFETSEGEFVVELFENQAPNTVANFISLVESKFYDGLSFHLTRPGQFAQAGCPIGDGSGNPGYKIANEIDPDKARHFFGGTLGMAHAGPDSAGSQFFITHQPNVSYDGTYVAFGRVIEGLDNVYKIRAADKTAEEPSPGVPSTIKSATLLRKRDHEYAPVKVVNPTPLTGNLPAGVPGGVPGINPVPGINNAEIPDVTPGVNSPKTGE
jgi:cyclophilin family peptidyl-prolyl cis-trans isomerase